MRGDGAFERMLSSMKAQEEDGCDEDVRPETPEEDEAMRELLMMQRLGTGAKLEGEIQAAAEAFEAQEWVTRQQRVRVRRFSIRPGCDVPARRAESRATADSIVSDLQQRQRLSREDACSLEAVELRLMLDSQAEELRKVQAELADVRHERDLLRESVSRSLAPLPSPPVFVPPSPAPIPKAGVSPAVSSEDINGALRAMLGRSLQKLAVELYSTQEHFVLELLQNADDNDYEDGILQVTCGFTCVCVSVPFARSETAPTHATACAASFAGLPRCRLGAGVLDGQLVCISTWFASTRESFLSVHQWR